MVCEIPFETLDDLSGKMPNLRQQIMRLMSGEIKGDQDMILLLSKKNAEERLAAFVYNLSRRFAERGFSPREFRLTMTRGDIGKGEKRRKKNNKKKNKRKKEEKNKKK
eukprot:TRINITY_DN10215_c0_g1_i1.p4 TRINITY_DN10215_c0_g1~~TRINITY_DN10215_c0_g1_i1.p4  ORF type:complete len:108 (+),score=14.22 TRINITY_DN10215_c0_g1_i1:3-326(+)